MSSLIDSEDKIEWNPAFRIEVIEETDAVYLFSESVKMGLQGKSYVLLVPLLLEGKYCVDEIVSQLSDCLSPEIVYFALQKLESKHLIQAVDFSLSSSIASYCGLLNVDTKTAAERLKFKCVYIQDLTNEVKDELHLLLSELCIRIVYDVKEAEIALLIVNDYLDLKEVDFPDCPCLLLKPFGSVFWIGPILGKDHPSCYQCIIARMNQNRLEESYVKHQKQLKSLISPLMTLKTSKQIGLNLAVQELFKWIVTGKNEPLKNKIFTLDLLHLKMEEHIVPRKTSCPHFRDLSKEKSAEIILTRRKKGKDYRCLTPEETIKKYSHHVSPIIGLIKYLKSSDKDLGAHFHVYDSGSNWAMNTALIGQTMSTFRNATSGKGTTDVAAKAGSLCEALERLSGLFQGNESIIWASYKELSTRAIHPHSLSLFSENQYQNRELINQEAHRFSIIGTIFSEEDQISWTPVWSLTEQSVKFIPTSYCYFSYPNSETEWKCAADSNGCAAGNCLEEAILQGFFELVERDSIAIWWYNRIRYPQIDLNSFNIPYLQIMIEEYAKLDREIIVLDITSDLGIPTCVAISRLKNADSENIFMGFGCHLDVEVALLRSITELNQFFGFADFWEEEEIFDDTQQKKDRKVVRQWMKEATFDNQPYLQPDGLRTALDYQKWESPDLLEDILQCRRIVESQGYEFLVLDQTREEIGLNVVRVIVPGLRHFWTRFAPGRLYEVPVKMGKLKAALNESELNPIPMFL